MNPKFIFFLLFIVLFVAFLFFARKEKHDTFHKVSLHGKLDTIYRYKDYVMLYVDGVEFRIIPIAINGSPQLDRIAQKGDNIFKSPDNDTLVLYHQDQKFLYYSQ